LNHKQFISLNGEMLPADEPSLFHTNRAFCYGDALFETIHGNGTKLQFFEDHLTRLQKGMHLLGMSNDNISAPGRIEALITRLLHRNHIYNGTRIRLTVFRDPGGLYTPDSSQCSFLVEATPLENDNYVINEKGLKAGLFTSLRKNRDVLANLKTSNSLLYVMAGLFKKEKGLNECFLLNAENRLAESISSNLFLIKDGVLATPCLAEGCVSGIMRRQILRLAGKHGIACEEREMGTEELLTADECFLTNSISGIQWVGAYGQKRYYSKTSKYLTSMLNLDVFGK
jgi:branched-subunit amino acid aminotransferase/4-amino-4-deoxychorismate lyase